LQKAEPSFKHAGAVAESALEHCHSPIRSPVRDRMRVRAIHFPGVRPLAK
jgi:hypothetical protein